MELIKSTNSISNATPKIVETPKHFSLNTQLYNKLSFKPYPMKFFTRDIGRLLSLYTSIDRPLTFYSYSHYSTIESLYNNEHNQINIIQDKTDHDIFYAIRPYNISTENHVIEKVKYDEVTMDYTVLNTVNIGTILEKARNHVKVLYENDDSIVIFAAGREATSGATSSKGILCIIDKKTFGVTPVSAANDDYCQFLLTTTDDSLYILRLSATTSYSSYYINKLNINTKIYTQIYEYTQTTNAQAKRTMCNPVKIGNDNYMLFSYFENNVYFYKMLKTSIDTNTDTVTTELYDIDLNKFVLDSSGSLNYGSSLYHTLRVIENGDNLYLSLLIHTAANSSSAALNALCKHALIKVENNTFTVIDMVNLPDGCYGSLEYVDSKHQIFFTSNSVLFYVFNETEEKMILTHKHAVLFSQIGLDSLNRIVLHTQDGAIEILTEGNSSTLKADFAEDIYNKNQNSTIESTVDFYAKNFLDEYVDTEVKLTLIGPVVFKENDSQILITSSSNEGLKSVPVTITGVGNIEVIITQNT